jgi:hypothetical protein
MKMMFVIFFQIDVFHNAETLKQQRPIGEGDQELEKRLVREESI